MLVLGAEPVLFSVDYPYSSIDDGIAFFRATPISGRDRELIAHVNAERLLKL